MTRMKKEILLILFIFSVISIGSFANSSCNYNDHTTDLCNCPSCINQGEVDIHNVGDFFAFFDNKVGNLYDNDFDLSASEYDIYNNKLKTNGIVELNLRKLKREKPYVYDTEGEVTLNIAGKKQLLEMEKLDYVFDEKNQRHCYRLKCNLAKEDDKNPVYILGYECGDSCTNLIGSISFFTPSDTIDLNYAFSIAGRNEFESESHLKQIARLSTY
ncbi:MAG: hypothetical protein ACPKM0_00680 [Pleomorphochaeta sp.]